MTTLADCHCDLGGGEAFYLKAIMTGEGKPMPLWNYILVFALKLRKSVENLGQVS
jgi:hypothetical protein